MRRARSVLLAALCGGLLAAPARADIIRAASAERAAPARPSRAVEGRLASLGVGPSEAAARLARMTPADLAYFGEREDRVQLVGEVPLHNFWYENVIGYAFLGASLFAISLLIIKNRDS